MSIVWSIKIVYVFALVLHCIAGYNSTDDSIRRRLQDDLPQDIAWYNYLEINSLPVRTGLITHNELLAEFNKSVLSSNAVLSTAQPEPTSWNAAMKKFNIYNQRKSHKLGKKNLIVYHIEDLILDDSLVEVALNNLRVFVTSIYHHTESSEQSAFYVFNCPTTSAALISNIIPDHMPNVATVSWTFTGSSMNSFLQTLRILNAETITSVDAVFCLGTGVRGPLAHVQAGSWISEFRKRLDVPMVGLVGAMISCEEGPHVQTHAFALRTSLVLQVLLELKRYYSSASTFPLEHYFKHRLTHAVRELSFHIASLHHSQQDLPSIFNPEKCQDLGKEAQEEIQSCAQNPQEVLFLRWSGESLGAKGFLCGKAIAMSATVRAEVDSLTQSITQIPIKANQKLPKDLHPMLPERVSGGVLTELYTEYDMEHTRELAAMETLKNSSISHTTARGSGAAAAPGLDEVDDFAQVDSVELVPDSKVCFLVRTAAMHDPAYVSTKTGKIKYVEMDLEVLAKSLIAQTNSNWLAYFIITDPSPFEKRLQEIITGFNDPRLAYYDVDMAHRPVFTVVDAGYTTTDYVLNKLLQRSECKWVSATNGDNAYGSEVVERILSASHLQDSTAQPDMLLLPMDSRNFADQDFILRNDRKWNHRCVGIEAMASLNQLVATAGSLPKIARVDLAAIVINRRKLLAEDVMFGNFSDPARFRCLGCNDGYFTQYLVRSRGWTYARLPVEGLRSLMFHGPSPTHCIAAGNVWFDHPQVNKVGCLSHETVHKMLRRDTKREKQRLFDMQHFTKSDRICLRLTATGHSMQSTVFQRRLATIPDSELSNDPNIFTKRHPRSEKPRTECDWPTYLTLNPDLGQNGITEEMAADHYKRLGQTENRECNFNWKYYLWANPDLIKAGVTTETAALNHYVCCGKPEGRLHRTPDGFDWMAYLETNFDLYHKKLETKYDAVIHYRNSGRNEFRPIVATTPKKQSWHKAIDKFNAFVSTTVAPVEKRNIIVYHVEDIGATDDAYDLTVNNVKVFVTAMLHHVQSKTSDQQAFYWFNVAGLMENPMKQLIPAHLSNVAVVDWMFISSPFNSFVQTMRQFTPLMLGSVGAVFLSSSGVRGPLLQYQDGAWIGEYRRLLDENNVGMVGPIIDCEGRPHIQNHMFATRTTIVALIVTELVSYSDLDVFVPLQEYFLKRLTELVLEASYKVASLLHWKQRNDPYFVNEACSVSIKPADSNTDSACTVHAKDVLFLRWSGEPWGAKGFLCGKGIAMNEKNREDVMALTKAMLSAPLGTDAVSNELLSSLHPMLPEAPTGWLIYDEFNREQRLQHNIASVGLNSEDSKVCFLVNVTSEHDTDKLLSKYSPTIQDLLHTLRIQTDPNWKAFLFSPDAAFTDRLRAIASETRDSRIAVTIAGPADQKEKVDFWNKLLQRSECKWVSATNGDNAYGSEVVERILSASHLQDSTAQPDMLLLPMDSVKYAELDFKRRGGGGWDKRCVGIETTIALNQLSYTVQPVPVPGRVFAPSIVLNRAKLVQESLKPDAISIPDLYLCPDCADGYLAQYLVRVRHWSFARLAMDGLRSIVFDAASPSLCIASGNIWFDHPCPGQARCLTYIQARQLQLGDKVRNISLFDWDSFLASDQICLRFSPKSFHALNCT